MKAPGSPADAGHGASESPSAPTVVIDVWSDYVCPFCYLEMPVLDRTRERFGAKSVRIAWRAFELRPEPLPTLDPAGEYLRTTWARSVYPVAAERGMTLRLPPVQPRSRKAFEATMFAQDAGFGEAMVRALFHAFFEQGADIGSVEVLAAVGAGVGIDVARLREALEHGTHLERVLHDEREAQRLGIRGVPAMVVRRTNNAPQTETLLSGALPYETVSAVVAALLGTG